MNHQLFNVDKGNFEDAPVITKKKKKRVNRKPKCKDNSDEYYKEDEVRKSMKEVSDKIEQICDNPSKFRTIGYAYDMDLLFDAITVGHLNMVKQLVNKDIKKCSKLYCTQKSQVLTYNCDKIKTTAFECACRFGRLDIVKYLMQRCGRNIINNGTHYPLSSAATHGYLPVVKFLVDNGAKVNHIDHQNNIPLMYAIISKSWASAEYLINADANINFQALNVNITPLYFAAKKNGIKIVKMLLDKGAKTDIKSGVKEFTPIYIASREGHYDVVKLLVEKNANVNLRTVENDTALLIALKNGHKGIATLLITKCDIECDIDCQQYDEYKDEIVSPLLLAMKAKYYNIIDLLLHKRANHAYIIRVHYQVGQIDPFMYNLLYLHNITIVRKMIKLIDVNRYFLNFCKYGPINKHTKSIIKEFLKHGVQINLRDNENKTALYYIEQRSQNSTDAEAVATLLKTHNIMSIDHASFYVAFRSKSRNFMIVSGVHISKHLVRTIGNFLKVSHGIV